MESQPAPQEKPATEDGKQQRFLNRPRRGGKSLWEWLDLFSKYSIPIAAAIVTAGFGLLQTHLADQQHRNDILETYIGHMQDLLLQQHLSTSKPGEEVRQAAIEQTLVTLRRLDAQQNRTIFQFLRDAGLIGMQDAVIDLRNADLSNDDLSGAHLDGVDLIGANLAGAKLDGATLSGATMYAANLNNANMVGATLTGAALTDASLVGVDLAGAHLRDATFSSATLTGARLNGATLTRANLSDAHMINADLSGADLSGAFLNNAALNGVDVSRADLSGADLRGYPTPALTQAQLNEVSSCINADLRYTGLICHHKPSVTLTYWYTETTAEARIMQKLIAEFERQHSGIKIDAVPKPFFQSRAALPIAAQGGGKAPDVLRSDVGWVPYFASKGYLLSIDSYITRRDIADYQRIKAPGGSRLSPLAYDEYSGHLYGLPQVTDCLALLYNKAELAKAGITHPPTNMDEFQRDAERVVRSKAARYGFETSGSSYYALPFLYAYGGGMFDHNNNVIVNSPGSLKGLKFLLKLEDDPAQVMPPRVDFSNGLSNMRTDFMSGKTAMILDGPWDVPVILTYGSRFEARPGNLGVAGIPMGPAGQDGSPLGGQSYVISAGTAHPAEAYDFISFMSSTPRQVAIAEANHTLPTRQSAYQGGACSDPLIKVFRHIWEKEATARPAVSEGGYLFDSFDPSIWAALVGVQSPNDALKAVADSWKQLGIRKQGP